MEWISSSLARQAHRVRVLRDRYEGLRNRLQRNDGLTELRRLDTSIDRRVRHLEHINQQIERLASERDQIETEVLGCLTGSEALLSDLVGRLEEIDGHDWTPIPITSFTMWRLIDSTMHDGCVPWRTSVAVGTCHRSTESPAPHATDQCAASGCGIVAMKSAGMLDGFDHDSMIAIGRLEMSGRVVEHEHGFRAELAEVVALIATDGQRWFRSHDRGQIEELFATPEQTFTRLSAPVPPEAVLYLEVDLFLADERSARGR